MRASIFRREPSRLHYVTVNQPEGRASVLASRVARRRLAFTLMMLFFGFSAFAQSRENIEGLTTDPRGKVEVTICSQNLKNFGVYTDWKVKEKKNKDFYEDKKKALSARFQYAECDIIALQEILGATVTQGEEALEELSDYLRKQTGRIFKTRIADDADGPTRVGFLIAADTAELFNATTYKKVNLPKLIDDQKPLFFSRSPLEIQVRVKGKDDSPTKTISIVTFHSKSKSGAKDDPAALQWETSRMQMAEGLRRILDERFKASFSFGEVPLVVLGDRNANLDAASSKILEGVVTLDNFKVGGTCRLSKNGRPLCQGGNQGAQKLFSVLTSDPETKGQQGTYLFKSEFSWLDDILLPQSSLAFARLNAGEEGNYDSGVVNGYPDASDHALVYVRLNW